MAFLNNFHDLYALGKSLTPYGLPDPALGPTRDIGGVPTIALVNAEGSHLYVGVDAPYRPYLVTTPGYPTPTTFTDWNAPTNPLPAARHRHRSTTPPRAEPKHHGWGKGTIGGQSPDTCADACGTEQLSCHPRDT